MKESARRMLALALTGALASSFALFGCTANTTSTTSASSSSGAAAQPVELQLFAANSLSKAMDEA